jgi:hypothetical protein
MIFPPCFESDNDTGMRVCLPPASREPIATDSMPPGEKFSTEAAPVPVLELGRWATQKFLQPNRRQLEEASYIASLYEGVPSEVGKRREAEFRQRKIERSLLA